MHRVSLAIGCLFAWSAAGCAGGTSVVCSGNDCEPQPECVVDADCTGVPCIDEMCAVSCADEDECSATSQSCRPLAVEGGTPAFVCADALSAFGELGDRCAANDACQTGICFNGRCSERCTSCAQEASCRSGVVDVAGTMVAADLCVPTLAKLDFEAGPLTVSATPASDTEFLVTITEPVASFTVTAIGEDPSLFTAIERVQAPDGTVLVDLTDGTPELNPPTFPVPGVTSIIVPSSDAPQASPTQGTYRFRFALYDPAMPTAPFVPVAGTIERVVVVTEPDSERGGLLDINLHVSPATNITAADAPTSAFVDNFLGEIDFFFRGFAGLGLGEVQFFDLSSDYDTIATFAEFRELVEMESLPGPNEAAINIFLVDDVQFTGGIAGAIPGPPGVFASPASGILVERIGSGSDTGILASHEMGHFLGLQHTTQIVFDPSPAITRHDAIDDTPECMGGLLTDCPDYRNLMFPQFPLSGLSLTQAQVEVVRANPMAYEVGRDGRCPQVPRVWDVTGPDTTSGFGSGRLGPAGVLSSQCVPGTGLGRVFLHRVREPGALELRVDVTASGFAPVAYVRRADCETSLEELACDTGGVDASLSLTVPNPTPGDYFIIVQSPDNDLGWTTVETLVE